MSTLYCPYCGREILGTDYPAARTKVQTHVRNVCKMKPTPEKVPV